MNGFRYGESSIKIRPYPRFLKNGPNFRIPLLSLLPLGFIYVNLLSKFIMQVDKDRDEEWPPGTVKLEGQ